MKRNEADTPAVPAAAKIGLVGPQGTTHPFVELWHSPAPNHFALLGHYLTEPAARRAAEAWGRGSYSLWTGPGRLLLRLEIGTIDKFSDH